MAKSMHEQEVRTPIDRHLTEGFGEGFLENRQPAVSKSFNMRSEVMREVWRRRRERAALGKVTNTIPALPGKAPVPSARTRFRKRWELLTAVIHDLRANNRDLRFLFGLLERNIGQRHMGKSARRLSRESNPGPQRRPDWPPQGADLEGDGKLKAPAPATLSACRGPPGRGRLSSGRISSGLLSEGFRRGATNEVQPTYKASESLCFTGCRDRYGLSIDISVTRQA
ncbi:hypothetical protein FA13DRAFT_1716724 [Coprinellus micaceus]|uniref:Uncharacterized protein n=1 Tax=Coprinellus micaceus TaxID=71717 RepID=A0A4Y7SIG6_COPMI|nr:hypothetical protein FA13DRAFT_1716724 [Coprinellus micaceus]